MQIQKCALAVLVSLTSTLSHANPFSFDVSVDTTPLAGVSGFIALDFIDGDGLVNNQATIADFSSDATLGALSLVGDATGNLIPGPLLLGDDTFFNEALQELTFGTSLSLRLVLTAEGSFSPSPDAFSFFLLDDTQFPFATDDPSGADALFFADVASVNPTPETFGSSFATADIVPTADNGTIPSPPTMILMVLGFVLWRWCR